MRHNHNQRGFTLVELLLAITVFGLLMALCGSLLRLGSNVWERTNGGAQAIAAVEAVQMLLRNEIAQTIPKRIGGPDAPIIAFDGAQDSIRFFAPLPMSLNRHAPVEIKLAAESSRETGKNLILSWRENETADWQPSVLLSSIKNIEISYFGGINGAIAAWQPAWTSQKTLPQAVKISVAFPPKDHRIWPDLILIPMTSFDAAELRGTIGANGQPL